MSLFRVVSGFGLSLSSFVGMNWRRSPSSLQRGEEVGSTDEGVFAADSKPAAPSSGALRHLLPAGEKREQAALSRRAITFALLWLFALTSPSLAADPVARATLQSKGKLYVGQQVLVDVAVLVPNYFLDPPQFPVFDLPGTTVTVQDGQALNLNETIDGTPYSGIQRTYVIVPQKDGAFSLPPAEITFGYAAVPGQTTDGKASLPSLQFTVEAAPGGTSGSPDVVAAKVTVTQDIDPDPKTLKAGDTLTRTITVRAEGLRAMMIPAPDFAALKGVRVYEQDPMLSEETNARSQPIAGVRKDVARYLFSDAGQYQLPAIELSWFDPAKAKNETVSAAAVSVSVAEAPAPSTGLAPPVPEPEAAPFNWFLTGVLGAMALLSGLVIGLLAQLLSLLELAFERRRSDSRQSEAAYFRHVEQACHDGSAAEIEKALDSWARKAGLVPLRPWIAHFGTLETIQAFDAQRQAVYGAITKKHISGERLLAGLHAARATWLTKTGGHTPLWRGTPLPKLNPDWNTGS